MATHASLTDGLQTRFFEGELRYDADTNAINGTALRYGDVATFPWGDKERFEAGAFDNISQADVIVHAQHERDKAIARTGGSGLTLTDSPTSLDFRAELDPEDTDAKNTLVKYRRRIFRGASIEFMPLQHRLEVNKDGGYTIVHIKAELRGIGIVDRPQYKQSTLREEVVMDEKQIRELIDSALSKRDDKGAPARDTDTAQLTAAIGVATRASVDAEVNARVTEAVDAAMKKREEEQAAAAAIAEAERAKAAKDDEGDDDDEDGKKKKKNPFKDMAEMEAEIQKRSDLRVQVASLDAH